MKLPSPLCAAAVAALVLAGHAAAQTVYTVQVSQTGTLNLEPAIITKGNESIVAWQALDEDRVWYAATTTGWNSFSYAQIPVGQCSWNGVTYDIAASGDAAVAAVKRSDGNYDLYAGGIALRGWYVVARKPFGSATVTLLATVGSCADPNGDKGFFAGGPDIYHPSADLLYFGFTNQNLESAHSTATTPIGSEWPTAGQAGSPSRVFSTYGLGRGAYPLVIRSANPSLSGQFVMGYSLDNGGDLPTVAVSAHRGEEGGQWPTASIFHFVSAWDPATSAAVDLTELGPPQNSQSFLPGTVRALGWPSLAFGQTHDANNREVLLAAFPARPSGALEDVDICVAYSYTAGAGSSSWFDSDPGHNHVAVIRIHDVQWRLTNEFGDSDEWNPSVGIDGQGRIYVQAIHTYSPDTSSNAQTLVTIRVAVWSSLQSLIAGGTPTVLQLSQQFHPTTGVGGNEYKMLCGTDCGADCAWASSQGNGTDWHIYMSRISYCPVADVDANAVLNTDDVLLFQNQFAALGALADLNGDGVIDCRDAVLFYGSFACGCNP